MGWFLQRRHLLFAGPHHTPFPVKKIIEKMTESCFKNSVQLRLIFIQTRIQILIMHSWQQSLMMSCPSSSSPTGRIIDLLESTAVNMKNVPFDFFEHLSCRVDKGDGRNPDLILFCFQQCVGVSQWSQVVQLSKTLVEFDL